MADAGSTLAAEMKAALTKYAAATPTAAGTTLADSTSAALAKYDSTPAPTTTTPTAPTTEPAPEPTPEPEPVDTGTGIWISPDRLKSLPTSGGAWDRVNTAAKGSWGSPDFSDNNNRHDTFTLAGALVAARTGDTAMRSKVVSALNAAVASTKYARVLEMSRGITCYVVAADVIDLSGTDDTKFRAFVSGLRTKSLSGHSGAGNMRDTALWSPNNWGCMSRAAMAVIDAYLGDTAGLKATAAAHAAWVGEPGYDTALGKLKFSTTTWHADSSKRLGINRRGTSRSGHSLDGVLPEDERRNTTDFVWPPTNSTSYPWEALQGELVAAVVLDRVGLVPFRAGDDALIRAAKWLYGPAANPATGDDLWQPWVFNKYGAGLPTAAATVGKNMAWTDWTHQ